MTEFKIYNLMLYALLTSLFSMPQSAVSLNHSYSGPVYRVSVSENSPLKTSVVKGDEDQAMPGFIWIIGEISLAVITGILLLIIYSWHLRKVVGKKTIELKNLNTNLEEKVEERTKELKESREEYKSMYSQAEEERKRTKAALKSEREAIKQNQNFIDMISHEYRTPVSVLSSSLDIIKKKCEMNDFHDLDNQVRKMRISIQRLIDIFDYSLGKDRVDNLTPRFNVEKLTLSHILNCAMELVKAVYINHKIMFDADHYKSVQISGDEKLLITVFSNILDNACKYSDPEGQIVINVDCGVDNVSIITTDSGMGIDQDEISFVFEKYYRSERTGVKQGAGVGLFLVKKIIELHKGSIELKSQLNKGTKVSVFLPVENE